MNDFHDRLETQLVRAASRPTRLRLARTPVPHPSAALPALAVIVLAAVSLGLLVTLKPEDVQTASNDSLLLSTPLERADGTGPLRLGDLRGRRTLVSFTASWCQPCRVNEAHLALAAGRGVRVVVITYDDTAEASAATARQLTSATVLRNDPQDVVFNETSAAGVPESFLLDAEGQVVDHVRGPLSREYVSELADAEAGQQGAGPGTQPLPRSGASTPSAPLPPQSGSTGATGKTGPSGATGPTFSAPGAVAP